MTLLMQQLSHVALEVPFVRYHVTFPASLQRLGRLYEVPVSAMAIERGRMDGNTDVGFWRRATTYSSLLLQVP